VSYAKRFSEDADIKAFTGAINPGEGVSIVVLDKHHTSRKTETKNSNSNMFFSPVSDHSAAYFTHT
jgi:hypothetical protein